MASQPHAETLHILFFPFMAPGHMLPLVDMAKMFSARGVKTTILTTPGNTSYVEPAIEVANNSGNNPQITLSLIPFPVEEFGLPKGCENAAKIDSGEMSAKFFKAIDRLHQPFNQVLRDQKPDAVVTDMFFPWTVDIAAEHGIPRLVFHGTSNFSTCVAYNKRTYKVLETLPSDTEKIVIPGLPHHVELLRSQEPNTTNRPDFVHLMSKVREAEAKSYGVVMNSFYELEPEYAKYYRNVIGSKTWNVGPVCLCNKDVNDKFRRGEAASVKSDQCLNWLDSKDPNSVIYVCFGSVSQFSQAQLREIALGLESSDRSFIWVVREPSEGEADWLPEGYEERVVGQGKGLVIKGWAPQILILNHPAVGGFMTHCGWNSSLEGISAGLPLITWPMFAEQFYNEKLIVNVIKTGVSIGVTDYVWREEEKKRKVVPAEQIAKPISWLMGRSKEAEEMRKRAWKLGEAAKEAVEVGGSSYVEMGNLLEALMERKN